MPPFTNSNRLLYLLFLFTLTTLFCLNSCDTSPIETGAMHTPVDSSQTRTSLNKRLSVKEAFLQLTDQELILDGLIDMNQQERKKLLQFSENDDYKMQWVGNYLRITQKKSSINDPTEPLEQLKLAVFNSLNKKRFLFVSQELIQAQRSQTTVVQQKFLEYYKKSWRAINNEIPLITTQTFLEKDVESSHLEDHIFIELSPLDVNYLHAQLIHEAYPDKDWIAKHEAYKVGLIWSGEQFQLHRQAMVQYDISEHHPR